MGLVPDPSPPDDLKRLCITVADPIVADVLSATAKRLGWTETPHRSAPCALLTDRAPARPAEQPAGNNVVLVCQTTPHGARAALDAVAGLRAAAIVCADQPNDLERALDGLLAGTASIPLRVLDLAARMPALTDRQIATLGGVLAGQANTEISAGLYVSLASIKRDLTHLYAALGARNRSSLVAQAIELGVAPCPVLP